MDLNQILNYYLKVVKSFNVFTGRARRSEYWYFILVNWIFTIALSSAGGFLGLGFISTVYALVMIVPGIAGGVRRMHDVGKSGWYLLIPIYNLILAVTDGDKGDNAYGPDPKA